MSTTMHSFLNVFIVLIYFKAFLAGACASPTHSFILFFYIFPLERDDLFTCLSLTGRLPRRASEWEWEVYHVKGFIQHINTEFNDALLELLIK